MSLLDLVEAFGGSKQSWRFRIRRFAGDAQAAVVAGPMRHGNNTYEGGSAQAAGHPKVLGGRAD